MSRDDQIWWRRFTGRLVIGALLLIDVYATGFFGGNERTLAIVRSIVLPGLPFLEWHVGIGLATIAVALASIGAWLRWGMDWLPILVIAGSVVVATFFMPLHHSPERTTPAHHSTDHHAAISPAGPSLNSETRVQPIIQPVLASHEFTIVLVIFALLARLRLLLGRLPLLSSWLHRLFPTAGFDARAVAQAAALRALSGQPTPANWNATREHLLNRARRVNQWARWWFRGDSLRRSHAATRAAFALCGDLTERQRIDLKEEAQRSLAGVPDSEPTWVRPVDGMLTALALHRLGDTDALARWRKTFDMHFALQQHGRRSAALHSASMLALGTLSDWEHATVSVLARELGWLNGDDWWIHLRTQCLGTAASGNADHDALRFIAAGRWWASLENDTEAAAILAKRTLAGDPLAEALDGWWSSNHAMHLESENTPQFIMLQSKAGSYS